MLTVRPSVMEQLQKGNVRKALLSSVILFDKFGGLYIPTIEKNLHTLKRDRKCLIIALFVCLISTHVFPLCLDILQEVRKKNL